MTKDENLESIYCIRHSLKSWHIGGLLDVFPPIVVSNEHYGRLVKRLEQENSDPRIFKNKLRSFAKAHNLPFDESKVRKDMGEYL